MFDFAITLIKKLRKDKTDGDYLVFLPGLFEIKAMKTLLINNAFH
jgi:HrpA-like RNA helicase